MDQLKRVVEDDVAKGRKGSYLVPPIALQMLADAVLVPMTLWFAMFLRFEVANFPSSFAGRLLAVAPLAALFLTLFGARFGVYATIGRYAGLREMWRLALLVGSTATLLLTAGEIFRLIQGESLIPRSVPVIWAPIGFLALSTLRLTPRLSFFMTRSGPSSTGADKILIVGAGDAGEHVVRDMLRRESQVCPVGFLDDDPKKIGKGIHGLPVLGPIVDLVSAVERTGAHQVVIALPNAPSKMVRSVVRLAEQAGVKAQILPTLAELMGEIPTTADVRDVDIGDLIGRRPVVLDVDQIATIFEGKTVLVTGAAGSIGSELGRQALRFSPEKLLLLDTNETDLYLLCQRLDPVARARGCELCMIIADIRDRHRLDLVFEEHLPHLVLHAAAYKHVNVMELHPSEAIKTNITGTRNVAEAAREGGAERFILVSTDKAVNPSSVMGATKRVAEMVLTQVAEGGATAFAAVRFGNVLGSRGSVVPILAEQIRRGGPLTVSHEDATRYFMSIEEAVSLILQAGAIARGGETFVLEMGEPVRIMDLAERMRDLLSEGRAKERIEIVITGLRPGEKLKEDLWQAGEVKLGRVQPGIQKVCSPAAYEGVELGAAVSELERIANNRHSPEELKQALFKVVTGSSQSLGVECAPSISKNETTDTEVEISHKLTSSSWLS